MAAGFTRALAASRFPVISSAGLEPGEVHPLAVEVMSELRIDISQQPSKLLQDFDPQHYHAVFCMDGYGLQLPDEWLMREIFQEWQAEDPQEQDSIEVFRQIRHDVEDQVNLLLSFLAMRKQDSVFQGYGQLRREG